MGKLTIDNDLICGECGHKFHYSTKSDYPNGPCPISCPKCGEYICPECGSNKFDNYDKDEESLEYCGSGCKECGWEHCGGCV